MISNNNLSELVTIGITTKNRWKDLQFTLKKIHNFGLDKLKILIIDDGSDIPCNFKISAIPLQIELLRFSESKGLIARRNELARRIETKYYLSFDDDSFPVYGSLNDVICFAESNPQLLCLSFPIYNPILDEEQSCSIYETPYPVKFFIGCGHLLHRQNFLRLDGYREELVRQGEEMDLGIRGFQCGLFCYHFPDFKIHHLASSISRNHYQIEFYLSRNKILWNDWYTPNELIWYQQLRTVIGLLIISIKIRSLGFLQGQLVGIKDISVYRYYRNRMPLKLMREWKKLPDC
jgi:GT2 family glycosyltransferase